MNSRWFIPVSLLLIVALLAVGVPVKERLLEERRKSGLSEVAFTKMPAVGAASLLLMGGFRGVAVDILWLRVNALHQERRYEEEISLIELIIHLQPYYTSVWIFQGWNIAYNISVQSTDLKIQWARVKYGIEFVKRGLQLNPNDVDLLFYLAHLHAEKVHQKEEFEEAMEREMGVNNFEEAARYYKLARKAKGRIQTFHPRVVDTGVWHAYHRRAVQILKRARLSDDLEFAPEDLLRAQHFIDICRRESPRLLKKWSYVNKQGRLVLEGAIVLYPLREDLVLFDGYRLQAQKALKEGNFSDASLVKAGKIIDKAWAELRRRIMKFDGGMLAAAVAFGSASVTPPMPFLHTCQHVKPVYRGVIQNKVNEGVSTIPWALLQEGGGVFRKPFITAADVLRARKLSLRALNLVKAARKADYGCRDQQELERLLPGWIGQLEQKLDKEGIPYPPRTGT